jgi:hypothetical protein
MLLISLDIIKKRHIYTIEIDFLPLGKIRHWPGIMNDFEVNLLHFFLNSNKSNHELNPGTSMPRFMAA